jgi:hypothetical protein
VQRAWTEGVPSDTADGWRTFRNAARLAASAVSSSVPSANMMRIDLRVWYEFWATPQHMPLELLAIMPPAAGVARAAHGLHHRPLRQGAARAEWWIEGCRLMGANILSFTSIRTRCILYISVMVARLGSQASRSLLRVACLATCAKKGQLTIGSSRQSRHFYEECCNPVPWAWAMTLLMIVWGFLPNCRRWPHDRVEVEITPPIMALSMEDGSGPILYWMGRLYFFLCWARILLASPPIKPASTVMLLPSP